MPDATGRLRILTWHVHGNYLYYLTRVPHEFHVVVDEQRSPHHSGLGGTLPWGGNVHEAPVETLREQVFDLVLYQSRDAYEREQYELLSPAQQRLPAIYLEHDPPQAHPVETRHWADDEKVAVVHVTHFNALMWKHTDSPVQVIEHGVALLDDARYDGRHGKGVVVVNDIERRGRRLGLDLWLSAREQVPLTLAGMGSMGVGGIGEVPHRELPAFMARHRFLFNPIRYTSLGLAVVEAMTVGLPIVGLATTEMPTVVRNGVNGWVDTRLDTLVDVMRRLVDDPELAREWGAAARRTALERFGIGRFVADWDALFRRQAGLPPADGIVHPIARTP